MIVRSVCTFFGLCTLAFSQHVHWTTSPLGSTSMKCGCGRTGWQAAHAGASRVRRQHPAREGQRATREYCGMSSYYTNAGIGLGHPREVLLRGREVYGRRSGITAWMRSSAYLRSPLHGQHSPRKWHKQRGTGLYWIRRRCRMFQSQVACRRPTILPDEEKAREKS